MSSFVAVRALRTAINNGNAPWRSYASTTKVTKQTKQSTASGTTEIKISDPPSNVFKKVDNAKDVGPGASKDGNYKNPEYFQYHQMSYAEMEVVMSKLRVPQPSNKPK